ncbi:hypothetical protein [Marinoscillum sp.]|uniref:hypothetical protein n=1 Tax=Marinoscillum sp. TaxID=2024838 RepID=UPI003BA92B4A
MKDVMEKQLTDLGFEKIYSNEYAEVYTNRSRKTISCKITADYVPIRFFIETFNQISKQVLHGSFEKFIFDKRELRTFHQPSMEWYFIEWKTKMIESGLVKHRKLLPDLPWFVKAVEIAKKPLLEKIPNEVMDQLDIIYCDSLEEALDR